MAHLWYHKIFHIFVPLGASGVLGSAVRNAFQVSGHDVIGLSHSRSGNGLVQLDLTNEVEVDIFFESDRPDCLLPLFALARFEYIFVIRGHSLCGRETS